MTVNIYSPTNSYKHRLGLGYDISSTNTSVTIKYFGAESTTGRLNGVETVLPQTYVRYNSPEYIEASVKLGSTTLVNLPKSDIYTAISTLNTERTYTINKTHAAQSLTLAYYRKEYGQELAPIGAESTSTIDWAFTASGTISVPAKPSYSVAFNANDGSGAPSAQTKWYGETLTLSSTKPTRQFYQFDGWATSATGAAAYCTGTNNASNTSYTANAAATLYAHWTRVHQAPTISSFTVSRCNANGDPDDEGTCCKAKVTWSVDTAVYSSNVGSTLSIGVSGVEGTKSVNLSGTGTTTEVVYDVAELGTDSSYRVTATVTDAQSKATSRTSVLSMAFFTMDFKEGGHGIGIGKPANDEVDNLLDIAMETRFNALATAQGTTSSSVEFGSTNPRFRFSNANATQNGELVFTDYDAVHSGATLAWITDQPNSWFHTQNIHVDGVLELSGTGIHNPSNIEFKPSSASANNGGYIDFHYNQSTADYTSRIIESASGVITIQAGAAYQFRSAGILSPAHSGVSYISGANGNAALYAKKGTGSVWYPAVCLDTTTGGSWQIGNFNTETLQFVWASKANRDSNTNTTVIINLPNVAGDTGYIPIPVRIYSSTATCATFTLSSSVANYNYLLIQFRGNDGFYNSMVVKNGKAAINVALAVIESTANASVNIKRVTYTLSGTSATVKTYGEMDGPNSATASKNVTVTGVWGWL